MNIVIDVGNSNINVGTFDKEIFLSSVNIDTKIYSIQELKQFFSTFNDEEIEAILYCSVVPDVNITFVSFLKSFYPDRSYVLNDMDIDLSMKVKDKKEVGGDLIADLYAAKKEKLAPCLIIDLGTATKFLLLDKDNTFSTCLIAPGMMVSYRSLFKSAALLEEVKIDHIPHILSPNETKEALVGGITYSFISLIEGVSERYEEALGYKLNKVITGGNANRIKSLFKDEYHFDPLLTLKGLNYILLDRKEK